MITFPDSPRLSRGSIVLANTATGTVQCTIPLQYNSDTLTRTAWVQIVGGECRDLLEALRLKESPVERFTT